MQNMTGGQNFSFPTFLDSYREQLLNPVKGIVFDNNKTNKIWICEPLWILLYLGWP